MKARSRFINSIVKTSCDSDVQMPWTRGERRAEFISRRKGLQVERKTA